MAIRISPIPTEYKYTPSEVTYTTKTGEVVTGRGVVYSTPQTDYGILAIIDNVMYIDMNYYDAIDDVEKRGQFGNPAFYVNGIKVPLTISGGFGPFSQNLIDGTIAILGDNFNTLTSEISYVIVPDSSSTQHSFQSIVPYVSKTDFTETVASTITIRSISRVKDSISFYIDNVNGSFGVSYDNGDGLSGEYVDNYTTNITALGDFAYVNIAGNLNSYEDWYSVPMTRGTNGENILEIANVENKDSYQSLITVRFFSNPVNIFTETINANISPFYQSNSVYSRF